MKHCPKHDILYGENGSCWCCDQAKNKTAQPQTSATKSARVPVATGGK